MQHNIIDKILNLPNAGAIVEAVQTALKEEAQQRQAFYEWITPSIKAEFINGNIIVHSPVRKLHEVTCSRLFCLLRDYAEERELGYVAHEKLMVSLTRNDYEPDIVFYRQTTAQHFQDDQVRFPAPDLVVEVLFRSTQERDRGIKFDDYALHGVQEYWLIDPQQQTLEQYTLKHAAYDLISIIQADHIIESRVVTGFRVTLAALFDKAMYREAREELGV